MILGLANYAPQQSFFDLNGPRRFFNEWLFSARVPIRRYSHRFFHLKWSRQFFQQIILFSAGGHNNRFCDQKDWSTPFFQNNVFSLRMDKTGAGQGRRSMGGVPRPNHGFVLLLLPGSHEVQLSSARPAPSDCGRIELKGVVAVTITWKNTQEACHRLKLCLRLPSDHMCCLLHELQRWSLNKHCYQTWEDKHGKPSKET